MKNSAILAKYNYTKHRGFNSYLGKGPTVPYLFSIFEQIYPSAEAKAYAIMYANLHLNGSRTKLREDDYSQKNRCYMPMASSAVYDADKEKQLQLLRFWSVNVVQNKTMERYLQVIEELDLVVCQ